MVNQQTVERGDETIPLQGIDCVLSEGLYALGNTAPMNLIDYADFAIYLETPLENIYDWKWERELKKKTPRTAEQFFYHMLAIVQDFAFHVYPTRRNADRIVVVEADHRYIVKRNNLEARNLADFTPLRLQTLQYDDNQAAF